MSSSYLSRSPQKQIQRQSRLISSGLYSKNKLSSSLPPIQRPMYTDINFYKNDPIQIQKASHQEYQIIIEFELKRQKEKTKILQERLKNKQMFIKQMKELQDELTTAFQKCQKQLNQYKCQVEQFHTFNKNNNLNQYVHSNQKKDNQIREYLEEIAQLKHLVIRLQQQITNHEKKEKQFNSKPTLQNKNSQRNKKHFSSVKNDFIQNQNSPFIQKEGKQKVREVRSKTMMNQQATSEQNQNIAKQVQKDPHKISSFINHFLTMVDFFNRYPNNSVSPFTNPINGQILNKDGLLKNRSLKHRLKIAWRWTKAVVLQWNYLKTRQFQQMKQFKLGNYLKKLFPGLNNQEIELYITNLMQKQIPKKTK